MKAHVFVRTMLLVALCPIVAALPAPDMAAAQGAPAGVTFEVGDGPEGIAFDGTALWVTNQFSNTVMKLSGDGAVLGTFAVGRRPIGVAADTGSVWVANHLSDTVTKLRASDGARLGTFAVGNGPGGIAAAGGEVWVANRNANTVTKLRASDGVVLGTFAVGRRPMGVAISATSAGTHVWVTNNKGNSVTKLRASDGVVVGTYRVGEGPFGIAFDGSSIWVANFFDGNVTKLSRDGVPLGIFATDDGSAGVLFDGNSIWVANNGNNTVTHLRPADGEVLETLAADAGPFGLAFDGSNLWVSNFSSNTVSKIATAAPPPPSRSGLVLALGFNEGSGLTAVDSSAAGNNGTITGATRTTGQTGFGGALSFDGVDDWVTVADAASLDLSSAMTLEAWVVPAALRGWNTVALKERSTGGLAYSLYAHDGAPTDPAGTDRPAGYMRIGFIDQPVRGTAALPLNTWTHVAVTYDGALMKLYVNAQLIAGHAQTGSVETSGDPLRIGGNSVWGEFFTGQIDEVRVYSRALSQAEIQTDMATPVP